MQLNILTGLVVAAPLRRLTTSERLPLGLRRRLAQLLFRREKLRWSAPFYVHHRGIRWHDDARDYIAWCIFFLGDFERESLNLCEYLGQHTDGAFVDVGANKGLYSAVLSKHFAKVIAFEPVRDLALKVQKAVGSNHLQNVEIRQLALGAEPGTATFNLPPASNRGQGSLLAIPDSSGSTTVQVSTGDIELADTKVGLLKIDVEGYEAFALKGLAQTLKRDRPFILFEIGESSKEPFRAAGGVLELLPPDYTVLEVPEHVAGAPFKLRPLAADDLLGRRISNNLAIPNERLPRIAQFIR